MHKLGINMKKGYALQINEYGLMLQLILAGNLLLIRHLLSLNLKRVKALIKTTRRSPIALDLSPGCLSKATNTLIIPLSTDILTRGVTN